MGRVAVFIDNAYLKRVHALFGIKTDYLKLSQEVVGNEERFRTYVYDCPPYQSNPPAPEESRRKSTFDSFRYNISRLPRFEFRLGRLQIIRNEKGEVIRKADGTPEMRQKGVDMALGIDLATLSATHNIQKCVIIAGDSDFAPAIVAAKQHGVFVTLYYHPATHIHDNLYEACDDRIEMTKELLEKCRMEKRLS